MSTLQLRRRKAAKERVRATDDEKGIVEAYVSVYNVEYRVGPFGQREIIEPGAFDASLADKETYPHFWSHNWPFGLMIGDSTPDSDDHGLKAVVSLDMDDELGRRTYRRHKSGAIDEFSIGYIPTAFKIDPDDEDLERVTEAQLIETSSVVLGANPETELIDVRARGGLVAPVLVANPDGALTVQWVASKEVEANSEPSTTTDDVVVVRDPGRMPDGQQNVDADELADAIVARLREREPALADDPALAERLSEPWVRDLLRERLSSQASTSE